MEKGSIFETGLIFDTVPSTGEMVGKGRQCPNCEGILVRIRAGEKNIHVCEGRCFVPDRLDMGR